jgi:hypothetical protein
MSHIVLKTFLLSLLCACFSFAQTDLSGKPQDPFHSAASVRVLLFVRTDCPITNRYAPEIKRIAGEFSPKQAEFWLVYPDRSETAAAIEAHIHDYQLPGTPLHDAQRVLVKRSLATVSPQAAVFDKTGKLVYSGRIDDRYADYGKSRPEPSVHDLEDAIKATLAGKPVAQRQTKAIGCYLSDLQ